MTSKPTLTPIFNNFAASLQIQLNGNENDDFLDELDLAQQKIQAQRGSSSTPALQGRATYPYGSLPVDDDSEDDILGRASAAASSSDVLRTPTKAPISKFFQGSDTPTSTPSSAYSTPSQASGTPLGQRTPAATDSPSSPWSGTTKTPKLIRGARHIIHRRDLTSTLIKDDKETLHRGLQHLENLSPQERQERTNEMRRIMTSRLQTEQQAQRLQEKFIAVHKAICEQESWITEVLRPLDITLVDRDHLTTFHHGKGKHICPLNDPLQSEIICRYYNPSNQVWAGTIRREKFSTFIPLNMTEDRYMTLVVQAGQNSHQIIAKSANKELFEIHHNGQRIVIECYLGAEGKILKTAYPLFHFETYRPSQKNLEVRYFFQYDLNDPRREGTYQVPYQLILQLIKQTDLPKTCCVYESVDAKIFDIAILFNKDCQKYDCCPIEQGMYVKFPKRYLN